MSKKSIIIQDSRKVESTTVIHTQSCQGDIFVNDEMGEQILMLTETEFSPDGSIHMYPSATEQGRHITTEGRVRQRGSCITLPTGESHFRPYHEGGIRSTPLCCTPHALARRTKRRCLVTFKFDIDTEPLQLVQTMVHEAEQMALELLRVMGKEGKEAQA